MALTDRPAPPTTTSWLPAGGTLPDEVWLRRHRWMLGVSWALLAASITVFVVRQETVTVPSWVVWAASAWLVLVTVVGSLPWPRLKASTARTVRSCATAYALMSSASFLVGLAAGAPEAHYLFFILIPLVALYEAWAPLLVAAGVVVAEQIIIGLLVPQAVFGEEVLVGGSVVTTSLVHLLLFAAACAAAVLAWRGAEVARSEASEVVGRLERTARRDLLTDLRNREGLFEALEAALGPEVQGGPSRRAAVVVMDLNRFKDVNDTLGHSAGDQLLRTLATELSALVPAGATLARLGGDEFALVLPGQDVDQATAVADRLRAHLRLGITFNGITLDLDVAAGVAAHAGSESLMGAGRARAAEEMVRHADIAMYVAKESRSGAVPFTPQLDQHSTARLEVARDLRLAVARDGELFLEFQPQVSLSDGSLVGVEALVRWEHPTRGLLPPTEFIHILNTTDLVHAFTDRVLALGLAQAEAWHREGYEVPVAVNISPWTLVNPDFTDRVVKALAAHRLPAHLLRLEITEDALVADPKAAADAITTLRGLGVRTAIDDFGTGFSSLFYLRGLPVDEVKLDRSFVAGLGSPQAGRTPAEGADEVLVSSIIDLAHRLGIEVVAEGVEHEHEADVLRRLGCDTVQGYLYGRPTAASAVSEDLMETAATTSEDVPAPARTPRAVRRPSAAPAARLPRPRKAVEAKPVAKAAKSAAGAGAKPAVKPAVKPVVKTAAKAVAAPATPARKAPAKAPAAAKATTVKATAVKAAAAKVVTTRTTAARSAVAKTAATKAAGTRTSAAAKTAAAPRSAVKVVAARPTTARTAATKTATTKSAAPAKTVAAAARTAARTSQSVSGTRSGPASRGRG